MSTIPNGVTTTTSDTIQGLDVTVDVTTPTWTDDTLPVCVDVTTNGILNDINIAIVLDTSGSTGGNSGSDLDGDGVNETFLEAQQIAAKELFDSYVQAGYDPEDINITLIEYNGGSSVLGTYSLDEQDDFNTAVDGFVANGQTNYSAGLQSVIDTWSADANVDDADTNAIVFLSDGRPTTGDGVAEFNTLANDFNAQVAAIGIGSNADLTALNAIDNTGSGAESVTDVSQLVDVVTAPPPLPDLDSVEIFIDGVSYGFYTPGDGVLNETPLGFQLNVDNIQGWPYTPGETLDIEVVTSFDNGGTVFTAAGVRIPVTICFAKGTSLLTKNGSQNIETLDVGDEVITRDNGYQKICWIGKTHVPFEAMAANSERRPVKIAAGALGKNVPAKDLVVSRQHRVLVEDWRAEVLFENSKVLVPAHALVNDDTIQNVLPVNGMELYHVVFEDHEVIFAEGLATESFYPCRATIEAMNPQARKELFALFPNLQLADADETVFEPAYPMLRSFEGRMLADELTL